MYFKGEMRTGTVGAGSDFHGFGPQIRKQLAARIPVDRDLRVLDVGTGFAGIAEFLALSLSDRSRIWTIDPSEDVLQNAKKILEAKHLGSRVELVKAGIEDFKAREGFFDIVVSVIAMHHLADIDVALARMAHLLKDGGRLLLIDYKPEAAQKLEFQSPHLESDFFAPKDVKAALLKIGLKASASSFGLWYLVEATK